ncbi:hypothetical protein AB0K60_31285 [Thermopolyspora sp. NPDC052614]|uniref:hypothetical protein n=1 Tax=Thermopolyspora sp. NPDC052614 TaxID=3155682 RepID=UPI003425D7B0
MSSRLRFLVIGGVLAGAYALPAAPAAAAAPQDTAPARSLTLGGNDPIGVSVDAIILNLLTS